MCNNTVNGTKSNVVTLPDHDKKRVKHNSFSFSDAKNHVFILPISFY